MTFNSWLLQQHTREDLVGDFAREARDDSEKPRTINGWRSHLHEHKACERAKRSLEEAWNEYKSLRKRLSSPQHFPKNQSTILHFP
jgi:hypothetical protein